MAGFGSGRVSGRGMGQRGNRNNCRGLCDGTGPGLGQGNGRKWLGRLAMNRETVSGTTQAHGFRCFGFKEGKAFPEVGGGRASGTGQRGGAIARIEAAIGDLRRQIAALKDKA